MDDYVADVRASLVCECVSVLLPQNKGDGPPKDVGTPDLTVGTIMKVEGVGKKTSRHARHETESDMHTYTYTYCLGLLARLSSSGLLTPLLRDKYFSRHFSPKFSLVAGNC